MMKTLLCIFLLSISSFALTLDQVRETLKSSPFSQDSVEMSIRTTVSSSAGKQVVSENLYRITGSKGVLYYDSKKKRIERFENNETKAQSLTTFVYDAENNLKTMNVSVMAGGVETKVTTEILALRSSKNFPDKIFEF